MGLVDRSVENLWGIICFTWNKFGDFPKALSELVVELPSPKRLVETERGRNGVPIALKEAAPAQIVVEVFGRNAVESAHPRFQSTVVGIDVLDVEDAVDDTNALLYVQSAMRNAG